MVLPTTMDPNHDQPSLSSSYQEQSLHSTTPTTLVSHAVREPSNTDLLLRHRSPCHIAPSSADAQNDDQELGGFSTTTTGDSEQRPKYQEFIDRIRMESAVRHPVPELHDDADEKTEPGNMWLWWYGWKRTLGLHRRRSDESSQLWTQYHHYSFDSLRKDCVAGTTVAILAVPLSMSYSKLAGLPAHYGLYASFVPTIVYPFLGTCRQLSVGPAALVSLLIVNGLSSIVRDEFNGTDVERGSAEYVARYTQLAIQSTFLAGLIQIGMGVLRMGFVTQFLSRALISGFTSAAAVIISISQLKHFLGVDVPTSKRSYKMVQGLIQRADAWNWKTFTMGMGSLVTLLLLKSLSQNPTLNKRYPSVKWLRPIGPFLVTVISILLTDTLDLESRGINVVGMIPPGLPNITVDQWTPLTPELLVSGNLLLC